MAAVCVCEDSQSVPIKTVHLPCPPCPSSLRLLLLCTATDLTPPDFAIRRVKKTSVPLDLARLGLDCSATIAVVLVRKSLLGITQLCAIRAVAAALNSSQIRHRELGGHKSRERRKPSSRSCLASRSAIRSIALFPSRSERECAVHLEVVLSFPSLGRAMVLGIVSLQHHGQTRNISWLESGLQGQLGVGGFPRDVAQEGVVQKRDGSMMVGRAGDDRGKSAWERSQNCFSGPRD